MTIPKNKYELLRMGQENFDNLIGLIDSFTHDEQLKEFPKGTMNRNIRDVLAHLHHWHLMFLEWYEVGMNNQKPYMPAKGYSWKDTPALNRKIWADYQEISLKNIREQLNYSFSKMKEIIERHTDKELFEKKRYKWAGSSSLGTYLRANTSSHYKWAYNLIKRAMKQRKI